MKTVFYVGLLLTVGCSDAFLALSKVVGGRNTKLFSSTLDDTTISPKEALLGLLGRTTDSQTARDPVLADPVTKESLVVEVPGTLLGGVSMQRVKYNLKSSNKTYSGSSNTYLNLLQDDANDSSEKTSQPLLNQVAKSFTPFLPPPLRSALGAATSTEYVPMRDLFTSPAVSFAYERGWRQGFSTAGFPGPDAEYEMAREYFAPAVAAANNPTNSNVVVDMSCATGLFTRRFASADEYDRVIGCDYSDSMLTEARRRIRVDSQLRNLQKTQLDLVRCDVGQIPMQTESVDAFHAGAAMHCWPDLEAAAKEIYRVLKPGGRYFATTFLSKYFSSIQYAEGGAQGPSTQAFQYFESVDQLRKLMEDGGFEHDKINIEVLGTACVVIRCEK